MGRKMTSVIQIKHCVSELVAVIQSYEMVEDSIFRSNLFSGSSTGEA